MNVDERDSKHHQGSIHDTLHSGFSLLPKRIALVAVDWTAATRRNSLRTNWDCGFAPYWTDIAATAEGSGCDTLVYALWSHDTRVAGVLNEKLLFGGTKSIRTVFLEVSDSHGGWWIEVWRQGRFAPHRFQQQFARSSDPDSSRRNFVAGLAARTFGKTMYLVCGEANIISTRRDSHAIRDPHGFMSHLAVAAPRLILNPTHDYMRRPEMKKKRALFSKDGRTVLSVRNRGNKPPEAVRPWQAFVDGSEATDRIQELDFLPTREIRIGVFDVA